MDAMLNELRFHSKFWIKIVVILSLILLLSACGSSDKKKHASMPPPKVIVSTVTTQSAASFLDLVAELEALNEVTIYSQVSGQLIQRKFEPGQAVKKGQLLFKIDPSTLDQSVLDAKANLSKAQAGLIQARQELARYRTLLPYNAATQQNYDQALSQVKQLEEQIKALDSGLQKAKLQRSFADIRAPISGHIGLQQIDVGTLITQAQTQLAQVSNLDSIAAYFSIDQANYVKLFKHHQNAKNSFEGRAVALVLEDGTYSSMGTLDFKSPTFDKETGTMTLRAIFPNPKHFLRPGMFARVHFIYDHDPDAISIPREAVTDVLGRKFVDVLTQDNTIEKRAIDVNSSSHAANLWRVKAGLKPGERIVVTGAFKTRQGMKVDPVTALN